MIHVVITDDHPLVVNGLMSALNDIPGIAITGAFHNAADLLAGLQAIEADILLLDLQLPDRSGGEIVPLLLKQYPKLRIIILSSLESTAFINQMMQIGCRGYLFKSNTLPDTLIRAIQEVHQGGLFLEAGLKEQLLQNMLTFKNSAEKHHPKITQREREVLILIKEELDNHEIAARLFISQRTVETHRYNLLQKLNAKNTAGLLRIARELGIT